MVILLNLIPWVIFLSGAVLFWTSKSDKTKVFALVGTVVLLGLYVKVQPSYIPKGDIQRTEAPKFASPEGVIKDRSPKASPLEDSRSQREEKYKNGLPF